MPQIEKSALVMYSTTEMFELVNDVDAYPAFLPHCSNAKVIDSDNQGMTASLEISKAGIKSGLLLKTNLTATELKCSL